MGGAYALFSNFLPYIPILLPLPSIRCHSAENRALTRAWPGSHLLLAHSQVSHRVRATLREMLTGPRGRDLHDLLRFCTDSESIVHVYM